MLTAVQNRAELWRLFAGLILAAFIVIALNTVLLGILSRLAPDIHNVDANGAAQPGSTPGSMLVTLYSFGLLIVAVILVVRVLHDRGVQSLTGPFQLGLTQFLRVVGILTAIAAALLLLPPYNMGLDLVSNLPVQKWLLLLPFGLLGVIIQSASEEVLFRGYIQQQLAARYPSPWIWMVLPSALFAAGHYLPGQAGDNAVLIALWAGMFGLLMADLTARAGTLGPAIAVHLANNASALLLVSLPDSLNGLALYVTPIPMSDTELLRTWMHVDFAMSIVFWLAARLAIRR